MSIRVRLVGITRLVLGLSLAMLLTSAELFGQAPPKLAEPFADLPWDAAQRSESVGELVDALTKIKEPVLNVWSNFSSGFPYVHEPARAVRIMGDKEPPYPPFLELTRRGIEAVPELLKHLDDARPTLVKEGDYRITVGDLCYCALGQILNEDYRVVSLGVFGGSQVDPISSKAERIKLVRERWRDITPAAHEQRLIKAVLKTDPYVDYGALRRLCVYYPKAAEETAVRLLNRTLYDAAKLHEFIVIDLCNEHDETKWEGLIENYIRENGEEVRELIPFWINWNYLESHIGWKPGEKLRAARFMKTFVPRFKRHAPVQLEITNLDQQVALVEVLRFFKSTRVDAAIHALLMKAQAFKFCRNLRILDSGDLFDLETFARIGFERLRETSYAADFRAFFLSKVAALENETPKNWPLIDRWHILATGKRKSPAPTAEQFQAMLALRELGLNVDEEYATEFEFSSDEDRRPLPAAAYRLLGKLTGLRKLRLENVDVTNEGLKELAGLAELNVISLERSSISSVGLAHLVQNQGLSSFNADHSTVGDVELAQIAKFKQLADLSLAATQITGKGLSHLRGLKSLNSLNLSDCRAIHNEDLASLAQLDQLTSLTTTAPELSDAGLKHLYGLANLKTLDLGYCRATPSGVTALRAELPRLQVEYYWRFQLQETPQGVTFVSPFVSVLFQEATLRGLSFDEDEAPAELKTPPGESPRRLRNKDGLGGGIRLSGSRNNAWGQSSNSVELRYSSQHDVTKFSLKCPKRGVPNERVQFELTFTNNGDTLSCGADTFKLTTPKRITIDSAGKTQELTSE